MLTDKVLRKHVALIHAYSQMSALQRKIVNVLLYEATKGNRAMYCNSSVAIECRISFSNVSKSINFNSNNTKYLKEAIDELASLKIEWNLLKDKVPADISFLNLRVLHGSPTFYQDGTFNFSFHKVFIDLVNNPSIYGTIDLNTQSQFESKYSLSLYENSTRFVNLKKSKVIQLSTFRKLLGVSEEKYLNLRELNRNVISPSVNEVNDIANFVVDLINIKNGKKIIAFEISVNAKKKTMTQVNEKTTSENKKIYETIKENFLTLNNNVLENIMRSYTEEYILDKIEYTKKHAKKESTGFYPIAYFISALKNDYRSSEIVPIEEPIIATGKTETWNEKLILLKADLTHWKMMNKYAIAHNNIQRITNTQKIIEECEEKLRKHHKEFI